MRVARRAPAQYKWCKEEPQLTDLTGVDERARAYVFATAANVTMTVLFTIALVVANLHTTLAAQVLSCLPEEPLKNACVARMSVADWEPVIGLEVHAQLFKTASGDGWVKMLALRYGAPGAAKQGDSGITQLFNVARTGSSGRDSDISLLITAARQYNFLAFRDSKNNRFHFPLLIAAVDGFRGY